MPIRGDFYPWTENNVNNIPSRAGVYAFYDSRVLIYIGSSNNLRERFQRYWSTNFQDDTCKRDTTSYKRELTNNYEQRERELLEEYRRQHNKLPRCNEVMP